MIESRILIPEELSPKLNVTLVTDVAGLAKVEDYLHTVDIFAYDTETNMTDDLTKRKIRTIQLGDREHQFVIDLLPFAEAAGITLEEAFAIPYKPHKCMQPIVDLLEPVLHSRSHKKVGHNFQFDYEVTKYCLGIRIYNIYCTFLAEKVIYAGRVSFNIAGFWALDDLVLRYLGLQMSKEEQTTFDLITPLTDRQIIYCALDCRLPLRCKDGQKEALDTGQLWIVLDIENSGIPAFGDMYLNGVGIDIKKWLRVVYKYKKLHKLHISKLDEFFIPIMGTKDFTDEHDLPEMEQRWRDESNKEKRAIYRKQFMTERKRLSELKKNFKNFPGRAAVNYGSPVALFNIMKTLPRFVEANRLAKEAAEKRQRGVSFFKDTNDRTLKNFAEHPKWDVEMAQEIDPTLSTAGLIDTLRLYRETEKLLNGYGTDWIRKNVNRTTGRVHGRLTQLGADTGRSSCRNPNMQQLPRGEEWRSCFIARHGNKIITMDYSGAELVILAHLSQDPTFVYAYKNGWDIHSVVAEIVFKDEWLAGTIHEETIIKGKKIPKCGYYYDSGKGDHKKCSCPEHKRTRNKAKPCGLGMAYGMEAQKLADATGVTYEEAEKIIKKFRESFPTLIEYLTKSGNDAKESCESRSLSNRRRSFNKPSYRDATIRAKRKLEERGIKDKAPSSKDISWVYRSMFSAIEREGKNNPLQASNADISKLAMGESTLLQDGKTIDMMWQILEPKFNAQLIMFVHDEFLIEVSEKLAQQCADYVEIAAVAAAAELITSVPMGVEYSIANEWKK